MSLQLCMKFFDFKNYQLILRGFVTQDEKIKHKNTLDVWSTKTQVKHFLLEKAKAFQPVRYAADFAGAYEAFVKESKSVITAIQLN